MVGCTRLKTWKELNGALQIRPNPGSLGLKWGQGKDAELAKRDKRIQEFKQMLRPPHLVLAASPFASSSPQGSAGAQSSLAVDLGPK